MRAASWPSADVWNRDAWRRGTPSSRALLAPAITSAQALPAAASLMPTLSPGVRHPLADARLSAALRTRAADIEQAFAAIEPALRSLAPQQFESDFAHRAASRLREQLGLDLAPALFAASWLQPLDLRRLQAQCVIGCFSRLVATAFDRSHALVSDGEQVETLIRRWGFHAIDITPCADGRLAGVVDYILRVPPAVVAFRQSHAGALFPVEDSLRHWERIELQRWRESRPNASEAGTRYLKIGVYHFSSRDPAHEGCAAHGSDTARAARRVLERLEQFEQTIRVHYGPRAGVATLLVGVDTDTDAIRVHVPAADGRMQADRYLDNLALFAHTRSLPREAAKEHIRTAVAEAAGVAADDAASEGMRWFCGYLLKNNIGQIDAVRDWHGGPYPEAGHTERLIVVGDPVDDVQLRNLAFQVQTETVEAATMDLDVGVRILHRLCQPQGLAVPVLVHMRHDARIPGSAEQAAERAQRLAAAISARHAARVAAGELVVQACIRAADEARLVPVEMLAEKAS